MSREGNFGLKIELVDGDSSIKNLFGLEHYKEENLFGLKNAKNLKKPGSAVLRITGEKGNYYVNEVFTVNIEPYQGPELKMTKNYIHVNLGEETDVASSFLDLCPDAEEGAGFKFKKGNKYNYGDVVNENFEWIDYSFRALKKGIYDAQLLPDQSNVEFEFNVKIYAGDYPYLLSTDAEAFPGTDIKVLADVLMEEAKDKEIEYTLEGNEKVTIDPEGRLSIAEDASGEVLIKAKPAGLDVEPAELKVKILGYNGKKPADSFDEATLKTFDYLGTNPLYSTESGSVWSTWLKQNSIGIDLGLSCGEKVTKVTVLPVRSPDELKELVLANSKAKNAIVINQEVLKDVPAETVSFLITAESQGHYAQRLLTLHTVPYSDPVNPELKEVVFVKPGESVNLFDYITASPNGSTCMPMIESDQKGTLTNNYSHEKGKKDVDLIYVSDKESTFTSFSEGYYTLAYQFNFENLMTVLSLPVVCSQTLTQDDFAFSIPDVDMAAGQKVTLNPVFANAELVNSEHKNDVVYFMVKGNPAGIQKQKDRTLEAVKNLEKTVEVVLEATSLYCPTQKTTVTVRIHPKTTAITASVDTEQLYLNSGKESTQIHAAAEPADAIQTFRYTSSNTKVASVDENGLITAVGTGKCKITIAAEDGTQKKATINISVLEPVTGISLDAEETTVQAGKSLKIKALLTPEKPSDKKISWEVKEPEFAEFVKISKEGVVNVQAKCPAGKMTILAKAEGAMPDQEVKAEIIIEITGK